jgi:hypothetical protein
MSVAPDSFQQWLTEQINDIFARSSHKQPFIIWCDPNGVWKDLLDMVKTGAGYELWAEEIHELQLRDRFVTEPPQKRIVWLPRARNNITYFKVFEGKADKIWEQSLESALIDYGISPAKIHELDESVAVFAKTQFGKPRLSWSNLTDRDTCDDDCILEVLAETGARFEDLQDTDRFAIFTRRVQQEFGLSDPSDANPKTWRINVLATLLCTDAQKKCHDIPLLDTTYIIKKEQQQEKALGLLSRWMKNTDYLPSFEKLAPETEKKTSLQNWAKGITLSKEIFASPAVERELWKKELKTIEALNSDTDLVAYLSDHIAIYACHDQGFWGKIAKTAVRWDYLIQFAEIAQQLHSQEGCTSKWRKSTQAISWFTTAGWQVDRTGETLFRDDMGLPPELLKVRTRLRIAYLHHLDTVNRTFSELLSKKGEIATDLPYAGERVGDILRKEGGKNPVALVFLDALRYDLGERLAELLNAGEPVKRALVESARAPIPSITALGMTYALPDIGNTIQVTIPDNDDFFMITSGESQGNLAIANQRREYLKQFFNLKDKKPKAFTSIRELIDMPPDEISTKIFGKYLVVFGDELDKEGHHDELRISGADELIDRYARVIRLIRNGGYTTIIIATDHGFFHWDPADDEIIPKPQGDLKWKCRRAIVGYDLNHPTAIRIPVSGSDLQCMVPRSVNAFETYGGIGYFHGGATLQELVIPVLTVTYPKKTKKVKCVIRPVEKIVSLEQRIEIAPGSVQSSLDGSLDESQMSRNVIVKVINNETGDLIFKSTQPIMIHPGGEFQYAVLQKVKGTQAPHNAKLTLRLYDDETEEILDEKTVILTVDADEWF